MKRAKISIVALMVLSIAACSTLKKGSKTSDNTVAGKSSETPASNNGIVSPGNAELVAIQAKHKEVTMETLKQGYALYTGVCTGCHPANNIYSHSEDKWKGIINDMAAKAQISDDQKRAVYSYVMAVKATQPK